MIPVFLNGVEHLTICCGPEAIYIRFLPWLMRNQTVKNTIHRVNREDRTEMP